MLKIIKRSVPLATEGTINRLKSDLADARGLTEARPFTAKETYPQGELFTHNGRVFTADVTIVTGETVTPGINCTETNIADALNAIQKGE